MTRLFLILQLFSLSALAQPMTLNDPVFLSGESASETLLNGLVAAWHFDEQVTSGNRVDAVSGITWYDAGGNIGSLRGVIGGAVSITNGAGNYLTVTNSQFQGTSGFTLAFWAIGQDANNSWIGQKKADGSAGDWFVDGTPKFQVTGGGVGRAINLTIPATVAWNFIVVGFDGSQMFASVNGAAKTTLACPSVDVTANMPFLNKWRLGGVDEVNFWSRGLSSSEITRLYNSGFGNAYPYTQTDPGVLFESNFGWAVTNAGAALGNTSSNALVGLIDGWTADGTWSGISYCLPFVPDSLTAALLPLVAPQAQDQNVFWIYPVNHGFVSGDLTSNGLGGNGSSYLDTGFNTSLLNPDSVGISIYAYTAPSGAYRENGTYVLGTGSGFDITINASDASPVGTVAYVGQESETIHVTPSPGAGFYHSSRTGNTTFNLYFANSTTSWASIGSNSTARSATLCNCNFDVFSVNIPGLSASYEPTADRLSYVDIHTGTSSGQGQLIYNRVQAYLTAKGGGYR